MSPLYVISTISPFCGSGTEDLCQWNTDLAGGYSFRRTFCRFHQKCIVFYGDDLSLKGYFPVCFRNLLGPGLFGNIVRTGSQ